MTRNDYFIERKRTFVQVSRIVAVVICVVFILGLFESDLSAQKSGTGIGIMVGEPTGISVKMDGRIALGLTWSFSGQESFQVHLDYLRHHRLFSGELREKLPLHYGIGGRVKLADKTMAGVRVPIGLTFHPSGLPIDVFVEVVPLLDVIPDVDFGFNSAIGARYYF